MQFFSSLQHLLQLPIPSEKISAFETFYTQYQNGEVLFEEEAVLLPCDAPSYKEYCKVVSPTQVPRRSNPAHKEGKIALLHAIAHIEYGAIDLALDAAYRFRSLPKAYYDDWLHVAHDEVRHFQMLHVILEELGSCYGALDVHDALFEAMQLTQDSLLERMAVVPRYLEANGLDATPQILSKLESIKDDVLIEKIKKALHVILDEEIEHVKKGDRWFAYACEQEGVGRSIYFYIIEKHYPKSFEKRRNLNTEARLQSGFTCNELSRMAHEDLC